MQNASPCKATAPRRERCTASGVTDPPPAVDIKEHFAAEVWLRQPLCTTLVRHGLPWAEQQMLSTAYSGTSV